MSVSQYTDLSSWGSWRTCCIPPQPPQGCSLSPSWPAWSGWGSLRWRPWTWGGRSSGHSTKKIKTLWLAGLQIPPFCLRPLDDPSHAHDVGVDGVGLVELRLGGDGLGLRDSSASLAVPINMRHCIYFVQRWRARTCNGSSRSNNHSHERQTPTNPTFSSLQRMGH